MFKYSEILRFGDYSELVDVMNDIYKFAQFMDGRKSSPFVPFCEHFKTVVVSVWVSTLRNGGYQEGDPIERRVRPMDFAIDTFTALAKTMAKNYPVDVFGEGYRLMGNFKINSLIVPFYLERREDGALAVVVADNAFDEATTAIGKYVTDGGITPPTEDLIRSALCDFSVAVTKAAIGDIEKARKLIASYEVYLITGKSAVCPIRVADVDGTDMDTLMDSLVAFVAWGALVHLPYLENPSEFTLVVQRNHVVVVSEKFAYDDDNETWKVI